MFNYKKAIQILAWLLRKSGGMAYKIMLIKLVYFADRYHLRKYGRTVSGDSYSALPLGPVGSNMLNVANQSEENLPPAALEMASETFEIQNNKTVLRLFNSDICASCLSQSDIEALDFSFSNFGHIDRFDLSEITHSYPEWGKHRDEIESCSGRKSIPMDIRDFLKDAPDGLNPCYELTEDDKAFILDAINESESIDRFFRINKNVAQF